MPTLKEFFNPGKVISSMGALKFPVSIFRDEIRYPNWEMDQTLKLYENRPQINSGIKQLARFILGEEIKAHSEDERSQEFLQAWIDQRSGIKTEILNVIIMALVTGNPYLEPTYVTSKNTGRTIIDNVFNIPDPSRVYYNLDHRKTDDEFWLYEVPIEVKVFPFQGTEYRPKYYRINYIRGSILFQRLIYAIAVHKTKLRHAKIGWSRDGIYGRSFLASAIDDGEILFEILKNLAIISRTRALNTKLISIGTEEDRATVEDMNKLDFDLKNRKEDEHIMINKPVSELNLSHQGQYDKMDTTIDYLRKDISSGLVPNFITPWNNEINRATAGEVKIPFQMELNSFKEDILLFMKEVIIDSLRQGYPWLADDLDFEFGHIDLTSTEEKMTYAQQMFRDNVMSMNEYREAAGYDRVDNGDVWAYQMPSLPVEQISQTTKTDDEGQISSGIPGQEKIMIGGGKPLPVAQVGKPKIEKHKKLTDTPHKPSFKERRSNGVRIIEQPLEEVFMELQVTAKAVEELAKGLGVATLIKSRTAKGTGLTLLQKGDKQKVMDMIYDNLNKNLSNKKNQRDFAQSMKDEIQKFKKAQPKYKDYVIERIARTELTRTREARKLLTYKQQGFEKVKHITILDESTGDMDRDMNGDILEIDELLKSENEDHRIPLHPNCRCTYVPVN